MSTATNTTVAIVDDDESLCRSFGRLLRVLGLQSVAYHSAEAFLADHAAPPFGCLVLDVQLLGMSGIELQRKLSRDGVKTPVIFITAFDDPAARQEAMSAGCAGYFRKTDLGASIMAAIRAAIAPPQSPVSASQ